MFLSLILILHITMSDFPHHPIAAPLKVVTNGPDGSRVPVAPLTSSNGNLGDEQGYDEQLIHKVGALMCNRCKLGNIIGCQ